jgi:hypothetical protein
MRRTFGGLLTLVLAAPAASQEPPAKPFVEKVEVRVRSVLVFITDSKGNALTKAPAPSDLAALENGSPVEILSVEPVRNTGTPTAGTDAESPVPLPEDPSAGLAQYLYLETSTLNMRSMPLLARAIDDNLDAILANGPLEIVGADPEPKVVLASSRDPEKIRETLRALPNTLPGKQRLLLLRKDSLADLRDAQNRPKSGAAGSVRAHVRMAVTEEISLLRHSLARLEAWAAARPDARAGLLYYANDGFDADPMEIYRESVSSQDFEMRREVEQLSQEFGKEVPKLLHQTESTLAGKGLTTIPLAFGGTLAEFAGNSANIGVRGGAALRRPTDSAPLFFYARPTEPLRLVAHATGGEVVTSASRFGRTIDSVGRAYVVTFRVQAVPDGRPHTFELTATRPDLKVRAPKHLLTGSPRATSIQRAIRVLEGSDRLTDVPVTAMLGDVARPPSAPAQGMLRVAANFGAVRDLLSADGPVRLRLSLAVELADGEPFTSSEEVDWSSDSTSWRYQVPLTWPREAKRIAVVVEEVSTGLTGSAIVAVPVAP